MDLWPFKILMTMVTTSPLVTTLAYLTTVSPLNHRVQLLSMFTMKWISSRFSMRFLSKFQIKTLFGGHPNGTPYSFLFAFLSLDYKTNYPFVTTILYYVHP